MYKAPLKNPLKKTYSKSDNLLQDALLILVFFFFFFFFKERLHFEMHFFIMLHMEICTSVFLVAFYSFLMKSRMLDCFCVLIFKSTRTLVTFATGSRDW